MRQVYNYIENIEPEEQTCVKLGQEFVDGNIEILVQVCFHAVFQLMELGCDNYEVDTPKIFPLVQKQYNCACRMLAKCKVQYLHRAEHLVQLERLKLILQVHTIKQSCTREA